MIYQLDEVFTEIMEVKQTKEKRTFSDKQNCNLNRNSLQYQKIAVTAEPVKTLNSSPTIRKKEDT
jgi:hypothetical protein